MANQSTTKYYKIKGKAYWAKVSPPGDVEYGHYNMLFAPDDMDEWLKVTGLKLKERVSPDDTPAVSLRRPFSKDFKKDGKVETVDFGPVPLFNADDSPIINERPHIGNGSKVTVKVSVYQTKKGPGHRLEAVRIDDLVEFVPVSQGNPIDLPF